MEEASGRNFFFIFFYFFYEIVKTTEVTSNILCIVYISGSVVLEGCYTVIMKIHVVLLNCPACSQLSLIFWPLLHSFCTVCLRLGAFHITFALWCSG